MTANIKKMPASGLIAEIELAINEKNYGRMYLVGDEMVSRASNDNSWLEAVVVVASYLVKNPGHVWNAVDLSKRAALASPENSEVQKLTIDSLLECIAVLPTPVDRAEAAHSVISVAPQISVLMKVSITLMLDNVESIDHTPTKRRYLKIAVYYAPPDSSIKSRADGMMKQVPEEERTEQNKADGSPWSKFLDKHKQRDDAPGKGDNKPKDRG